MTTGMSHSERATLRRILRRKRRDISLRERRRAAHAVAARLLNQPAVRRAHHVAIYEAHGSELSLQIFRQRCESQGKKLYLPRVERHRFSFLPANGRQRRNRFGIAEPRTGRSRPPWAMDVILVPLLGIDPQGNRLGQGGGFYDRCLARLRLRRPRLIGIAYDCQIVDALPPAPWDIPLDAAVTPTQTLSFRAFRHGLLVDENRAQ